MRLILIAAALSYACGGVVFGQLVVRAVSPFEVELRELQKEAVEDFCGFHPYVVVGSKPRIVVLGDSITKGVRSGVSPEQTYGEVLRRRLLEKGMDYEVINRGIGGERTDQAVQRLARDVLAVEPQLVTVMYGTNDSYVDKGRTESRISADEFEQHLRTIVGELRRSGIRVVLMTEPAWGASAVLNGAGEHPNVRLASYMERTRKVAAETGVPLVDHFRIWSEAAAGGVEIGGWTTDQCHPNGAGHEKLAEGILGVVKW